MTTTNNTSGIFRKSITKDELHLMPVKAFEGDIEVIDSSIGVRHALSYLQHQPVLGFDTETKPNFRRGSTNKVALLQLATEDKAFLFRLNRIGLPMTVAGLLAAPDIVKVGVAIHDDIKVLQSLFRYSPAGFIDLQKFVKRFDIDDAGLSKLAAIVMNFRISKRQQLSNWENMELTRPQLVYAATDAWVSYVIYNKLLSFSGQELNNQSFAISFDE